jgi:hypothetical protein
MNKIHIKSIEELKAELEKRASKVSVEEFEKLMRKGKRIAAIQLLKHHGIDVGD